MPEPSAFDLELAERAWIPEGTEILVSTPVTDVLRGAVWLHGLPWALLVLGAVLGAAAGFGDFGSLVGSASGLAVSWLLLRLTRHRWGALPASSLRIAPAR
jgi:positive regulator of sigma E activity